MTNDEVGRAYQQLLTSEPDVLEEGSAFAFAEADVPRRKVAQGWLALSQSLWVDAQGVLPQAPPLDGSDVTPEQDQCGDLRVLAVRAPDPT